MLPGSSLEKSHRSQYPLYVPLSNANANSVLQSPSANSTGEVENQARYAGRNLFRRKRSLVWLSGALLLEGCPFCSPLPAASCFLLVASVLPCAAFLLPCCYLFDT